MAEPIRLHPQAGCPAKDNVLYLHKKQENTVKLRKDGTPKKICQNKKKGRKSEVYAFEAEDMRRMLRYFEEHEQWIHYLLMVLGCNMARRVGDTLSLTWFHFFDPKTGNFRSELLEIEEDKTDKLANPRINSACQAAIRLYLDKTQCDPSKDGYSLPVFLQLSGTHKGNILTDDGHRKAIKKAAQALGITYNVGTHSARKTFGATSRMLHPNDYDSMELLQTIYNHSDTKTTKHYIGLTKQKVNGYYDDMGEFFEDYIVGDKQYQIGTQSPIVSLNSCDLRDILKAAYEAGRGNAGDDDVMTHVDAMNTLLDMVEQLSK